MYASFATHTVISVVMVLQIQSRLASIRLASDGLLTSSSPACTYASSSRGKPSKSPQQGIWVSDCWRSVVKCHWVGTCIWHSRKSMPVIMVQSLYRRIVTALLHAGSSADQWVLWWQLSHSCYATNLSLSQRWRLRWRAHVIRIFQPCQRYMCLVHE